MSSIYITSRLHAAWSRSAKDWARELRRVSGPDSGYTGLAPLPSLVEPPPEEFGTVLRALLPYVNHGVNHVTASAILSASTASMGISPEALHPLTYFSGVSPPGGICVRYPADWIGCPFVMVEDFPLSPFFGPVIPNNIQPFPPASRGQVVFSAGRGVNLWPRTFANIGELTEETLPLVHQRELERVPAARGTFVDCFISNLRYTGCVRPATDAEIDFLFLNILRSECWLKTPEFNFRDFFIGSGINESALSEALERTDAGLRATTSGVGPSSVTDVPSPRPRNTREQRLRDAMGAATSVTTESARADPPAPAPTRRATGSFNRRVSTASEQRSSLLEDTIFIPSSMPRAGYSSTDQLNGSPVSQQSDGDVYYDEVAPPEPPQPRILPVLPN